MSAIINPIDETASVRLLTIVEAAAKLNVSRKFIFNLIDRGDLPVIKFSARAYRIRESAVYELIARLEK